MISSVCERRRPPGDLELFVEARVLHEHLEHEAVLLRFGQRVGAFLLDRVLRGQHEERVGELVPHAADRDLPLLHGFEQRGLRLGRRAVDFVGQDDVGEQRALAGTGTRGGRSMRFSSMTSVPVMSAGIRSGVNWMRLKSSDRHLDSVLIISVLARPARLPACSGRG